MPFTRRRRAPVRRRRVPRKNNYVRKVARAEARRVVNRNTETKYFDTRQVATGVTYSGVAQALTYDPSAAVYLSQGTTDTDYLGQKIRPMYAEIRGTAEINGDTYNKIRIVVVQVKGSVNDTPNANVILQSVGNAQTPLSNYDIDHIDQVRVLADRLFEVDTYKPLKMFRIRLPMKKMHPINFTDNAGTTATGGLVAYFYSDSAASTPPLLEWYTRLAFKDA